jgi:hypothetical protein
MLMPKKNKTRTRIGAAKIISLLKKLYKKVGKSGSIFLVLLIVAAMLLAMKQVAIYREKRMYDKAEKEISQFINRASSLYPNTNEVKNYCSYTSEKFSRGSLGCSISTILEYLPADEEKIKWITQAIDSKQKLINWEYLGENTKGNREYISENYLKSQIYQTGSLTCGIHYKYKEDTEKNRLYHDGKPILIIQASCTGPALREYY